jgi:hypothetical protein
MGCRRSPLDAEGLARAGLHHESCVVERRSQPDALLTVKNDIEVGHATSASSLVAN